MLMLLMMMMMEMSELTVNWDQWLISGIQVMASTCRHEHPACINKLIDVADIITITTIIELHC